MYPILCEDGKVYYGLTLLTFGKGIRKARPLCRLLNAALPTGLPVRGTRPQEERYKRRRDPAGTGGDRGESSRRRSAISCRRTVGRPEHDLLRSSGNQHLHHHIQSCARQRDGRRRRGRPELSVRSKKHLFSGKKVCEKQKAAPQADPLRRLIRHRLHRAFPSHPLHK